MVTILDESDNGDIVDGNEVVSRGSARTILLFIKIVHIKRRRKPSMG